MPLNVGLHAKCSRLTGKFDVAGSISDYKFAIGSRINVLTAHAQILSSQKSPKMVSRSRNWTDSEFVWTLTCSLYDWHWRCCAFSVTSCGFIDFTFALLLKIHLRFLGSFLRFHSIPLCARGKNGKLGHNWRLLESVESGRTLWSLMQLDSTSWLLLHPLNTRFLHCPTAFTFGCLYDSWLTVY